MKIGIDDIKIPHYYTAPRPEKYSEKLNSYLMGKTLSPIIVDNDLNLVDGYITYLIYKYSGALLVEAYYEDELPVIYIHGNHPHSIKEYTWYVPRGLSKKFKKKVRIGDTVRCRANNKVVPVIVKEIFMKDEREHNIAPVVSI